MSDTAVKVPATASSAAPANKITRGHSCRNCQQRKVKCDGQRPCSTCVKNAVECIAKPPSQPRRPRKREAPKHDVLSRIQKLERELLNKSEDKDSPSTTFSTPEASNLGFSSTTSKSQSPKKDNGGVMVREGGHSRYVENTFWAGLKNELQTTSDSAQRSDESHQRAAEGLIFGPSDQGSNATPCHPSAVHIFKLWQTFLDNINPLVKLFHAPTLQQIILEAIGDLEKITTSTEVVMFSIYLSAVVSMNDGNCRTSFGESRIALIDKYVRCTETALRNAQFLKSYDIAVLQALTLYLLAMRQQYDSQSLWLLSGIAVRAGQRIGLHRESTSQGFSVFNAEIRRRVWWQINVLDSVAAKRSGAALHATLRLLSDTRKPLNINDSDLWPSMREPPKEHAGITEMLFTRIRCDVGEFMVHSRWSSSCLNGQLPFGPAITDNEIPIEEKDKSISELEAQLESRFLRFCDPSVSMHRLAIRLGKGVIAQLRLAAHHPYQYADRGASLPQREKDMLFSTALQILEFHNSANSDPGLQGFLWHINVVFPFEAFIYALRELQNQTDGEVAAKGRFLIEKAYEYHPELINESDNALYFAMGHLAIKAWRSSPVAQKGSGKHFSHPVPSFITKLESQRNGRRDEADQQSSTPADIIPNQLNDNHLYPSSAHWNASGSEIGQPFFSTSLTMDNAAQMDWEYWQTLLDGPQALMTYGTDLKNLAYN